MEQDPIRRVKYTPNNPQTPSSTCHRPEGHELEFQEFHLRSAARRESALHTAGVAEGLEITGTLGASKVSVSPGVAFDRLGRMLASPEAVEVELAGSAGTTMTVAIEFREAEVTPNPTPMVAPCGVLEQRPAVSLRIDPGDAVVLGRVKVSAQGLLESLSAEGRELVGFSCGRLVLLRPSDEAGAGQAVAATVSPLDRGVEVELRDGPLSIQGDVVVEGKVNGRDVGLDGSSLDGHVADRANPHRTSAAQVGALPIGGGTLTGGLAIQGALSVSGQISGTIAAGAVGNSQIANKVIERKHLTNTLVKEAIDDQTNEINNLKQSLQALSNRTLKCAVVSKIFGQNNDVLPVIPNTTDLLLGTFGSQIVAIIVTPINNIGDFQTLITAIPVPTGNKAKVRLARSGPIQLQVNFHIIFI